MHVARTMCRKKYENGPVWPVNPSQVSFAVVREKSKSGTKGTKTDPARVSRPLARIAAPTHSPPDPPILANHPRGEKRFMKLVRFGAPGREKPGIIDDKGRIRDLSAIVPDI